MSHQHICIHTLCSQATKAVVSAVSLEQSHGHQSPPKQAASQVGVITGAYGILILLKPSRIVKAIGGTEHSTRTFGRSA